MPGKFCTITYVQKFLAKTVAFGTKPESDNLRWLGAYEVKRQQQIEYLGLPLPLKEILHLKSTSLFCRNVALC